MLAKINRNNKFIAIIGVLLLSCQHFLAVANVNNNSLKLTTDSSLIGAEKEIHTNNNENGGLRKQKQERTLQVQLDPESIPQTGTTTATNNYHFQISIEGIPMVNQQVVSISGIVSETNSNGRVKYDDVTLERVFTGVDDFYDWRIEVEDGNTNGRDMTIAMLNSEFEIVRAVLLERAWPSKWEMPDMADTVVSSSSSPALERITLTVGRARELH